MCATSSIYIHVYSNYSSLISRVDHTVKCRVTGEQRYGYNKLQPGLTNFFLEICTYEAKVPKTWEARLAFTLVHFTCTRKWTVVLLSKLVDHAAYLAPSTSFSHMLHQCCNYHASSRPSFLYSYKIQLYLQLLQASYFIQASQFINYLGKVEVCH